MVNTVNNKVPWRDLLNELRNRDDRWGKLLDAKFDSLESEIKEMQIQLDQICKSGLDNEERIRKLEVMSAVMKSTRADCQVQTELRIKKWQVWVVIIAACIAATAAIIAAVL